MGDQRTALRVHGQQTSTGAAHRQDGAHACAQALFLGLRGVVIFTLRDSRPGPADHDYWGFHAGLFDLKGQPKPSLAALRQAARRVRS